jgi:KDO2-lipid IV(A) lauroyltransferase
VSVHAIGAQQKRPNSQFWLAPLNAVVFAAALILYAFFRIVGVDAASAIAGGFCRHVGPLVRPISRRAERNLEMIFPDMTARERRRVVAGVWENLGRTSAEFVHLDAFRPFSEGGRVEMLGGERLLDIAREKRSVIFVSGHFANWEIMSIAFWRAGIEYAVLYRPVNNPFVDRIIVRSRSKVMSPHHIPKGKAGGRALIEALKNGKSLAMLVDQKLNEGIEVPLLGRGAMTAPAAARLSLKFGVPIVPVWIERLKGARFRMQVEPPIEFSPSGNSEADILALTTRVNEALERRIRARPEQWLWLHRRWPLAGAIGEERGSHYLGDEGCPN